MLYQHQLLLCNWIISGIFSFLDRFWRQILLCIWNVFTAVSPSVNCFIYLVLVVSPCCSAVFGKASEATISRELCIYIWYYDNKYIQWIARLSRSGSTSSILSKKIITYYRTSFKSENTKKSYLVDTKLSRQKINHE